MCKAFSLFGINTHWKLQTGNEGLEAGIFFDRINRINRMNRIQTGNEGLETRN